MRITPFFLFFLFPFFLQAALPKLIPYRKGDKWGFCDSTKKIIIAPQYDEVGFQVRGSYAVLLKNKWGLLDQNGKIIAPFIYDDMEESEQSDSTIDIYHYSVLASFSKVGLMNYDGRIIIPMIYDEINFDYYQGKDTASVLVNHLFGFRYGIIQAHSGKIIVPAKYDNPIDNYYGSTGFYTVSSRGKYGVVREDGKVVIPCKYQYIYDDEENFPYYEAVYGTTGSTVVIDTSGRIFCAIANGYLQEAKDSLFIMHDRRFHSNVLKNGDGKKNNSTPFNLTFEGPTYGNRVLDSFPRQKSFVVGDKHKQKLGIINYRNELLTKCEYDDIEIYWFQDGYVFYAQKKGQQFFISSDGKSITPLPPSSSDFRPFKNFILVLDSGQYGAINYKGDTIIPFIYSNLYHEDGSDFIIYTKNKKQGLFDLNGKEIPSVKNAVYGSFENYSYDNGSILNSGGLSRVMKRDSSEWTTINFIDRSGKLVFPEGKFDTIERTGYDSPYYLAKNSNGKYGIINEKGKIIVADTFSKPIGYAKDGNFFTVQSPTRIFWTDSSAKIISDIYNDYDFLVYHPGFWVMKKEGKREIVDSCGKPIVPLQKGKVINVDITIFGTMIYFRNENGLVDVYTPCGRKISGMSGIADSIASIIDCPYFKFYTVDHKFFGVRDTTGKIIIPVKNYSGISYNPPNYSSADEYFGFSDDEGVNYQLVPDTTVYITNGLFLHGLADRNGKEIVPEIYESIDYACPGFFIVKKDSLYGVIDNKGEFLIPLSTNPIYYENNNLFLILKPSKEDPGRFEDLGYVDTKGNIYWEE